MSFQNANNFVINGLNQWDVRVEEGHSERKKINGFERLLESIAPGAFHNSSERFDPPKCHPETRKAVLSNIMSWADAPLTRSSSVMWLYGPAGAGKSAIAQSIAERCQAEGKLLASFFFSRLVADRSTEKHLVPTIAYQLSLSLSQSRVFIEKAVEKDPSIFSRSLEVQIQHMLVEPLLAAMADPSTHKPLHPELIIIDGLDECIHPKVQRAILQSISRAMLRYHLPICLLISSRPEQEIRDAFKLDEISRICTHLVLDDSLDPDKDLDIFLRSKFGVLKHQHPSGPFPDSWPADQSIEKLVQRSSGQFIYAAVVMNYISDPRHRPTKRLDIVLGIVPRGKDTPFAQLDALYVFILSTVEDILRTSRILGALLYLADGNKCPFPAEVLKSPMFLDEFLGLDNDTCLLLSDLHSILSVPGHLSSTTPIRMFHASLSDFLRDQSRAGGEFYLDKKLVNADLAHCCFVNSAMRPMIEYNHVKSYSAAYLFNHCLSCTPTEELLEHLCAEDLLVVWKVNHEYVNGVTMRDKAIEELTQLRNMLSTLSDILHPLAIQLLENLEHNLMLLKQSPDWPLHVKGDISHLGGKDSFELRDNTRESADKHRFFRRILQPVRRKFRRKHSSVEEIAAKCD